MGLTIGSLFAGIGGFDLAGEWCGHRTIWTSEIDPYCVALLAERFPAAKQLGDISTIDWASVERPDILTGGFPCQDISYAGKGAGLAGKRSGLWYEYARAIREVGPRYVIVENVAALLERGMGDVLGTLADIGYDAEWGSISARSVGGPHLRERIFILAYNRGAGGQGYEPQKISRQPAFSWCEDVRGVADLRGRSDLPEPYIRRISNGIRTRLHGLGNAIVPDCAVPVYRRIAELEGQRLMQEAA